MRRRCTGILSVRRIVVQCPRPRRLSLDKDDRKNGDFAAVTRRRGAGWRWARVRELHPQVRAARGGSSSHLHSSSSDNDDNTLSIATTIAILSSFEFNVLVSARV
ncbi:unnamed protein product [Spirodela intermedia]|uniref:Uncharacterized protein n=1 Tax=Spirodela intermedia TaxID=51605 RepID=A0ABN7E990_SPIIN|nr:unnamed protein product [Spirodela intermedia]CAA6674531.1 unnamed protein product [Spirodela intermedia]